MPKDNKALEICRKNTKEKPLDYINKAHPWIKKVAQDLREVFGEYAGVKVFEGEPIYSWSKKQAFVKPTNILPADRYPHVWSNREGQVWNSERLMWVKKGKNGK